MRIHRDERGQTIILVALSLPLLLGFVGIATDVGALFKDKRDIQTAADAAAIAGAQNITTGNWNSAATAMATSYGFTDGSNGATVTVYNGPKWAASNYLNQTNYIEVTISKQESTIFLALFGFPSVNVLARAVGTNQGAGNGCVYTLGTTGTDLTVQGNPGITAPSCAFNVNSGSSNAVQEIGKGGTVTTSSIGVVGPITQGKSYSDFQPQPVGGAVAASDPMSANEFPYTCTSAGCTCTTGAVGADCTNNPIPTANMPSICNTFSVPNQGTTTLNPGCYDLGGGTTVGAQATLTLNDSGGGVYFFTNGTLTLQAGATMNAVGTTMIFTGNSTINMIGNPTLDMVAPTTDPNALPPASAGYNPSATFPGTLYYQVPADTAPLNLGGGANATIVGIFYAPTASVTMQGTPGGTLYTDFVVGALTLAGTPNFNSYAQLPGGASNGLHSVTLVE